MAPTLVVEEALRPVLEALVRLEPLYHAAHAEATPAHFEQLVAPEFREIGASGQRYSRAFALQVLRERERVPAQADWVTKDHHLASLAEGVVLLTYTLIQPGRVTARSTIWKQVHHGWQAVFHQGTVVISPGY